MYLLLIMPKLTIKTVFLTLIFSLLFTSCLPKKQNADGVTNDADESTVLTETTEDSLNNNDNPFSINLKSDPRLPTFKMVSASEFHAIAIKTDGTLWVWGLNDWGMLGDGTEEKRISPVRIGTDNDWAYVSAGWSHSVALKTDGSLWAWGSNSHGQLGDGAEIHRYSPVRIGTDNDWSFISAGDSFNIAIKTDGSMWGWGSNAFSQIGDFVNGKNVYIPTRIGSDNDWAFVSTGYSSNLAIKTDGSLWTWGEIVGGNGREKANIYVKIGRPDRVGTENDWVSAATMNNSYVAIKKDGTLWVWGFDFGSQYVSRQYPKQIGTDTDWLTVSVNRYNAMAIKTDGSLWAWGWLGEDIIFLEYSDIEVPVRLWGNTNWAYISARVCYALAIMTDGSLWAWGTRNRGEIYSERNCLGDGTEEDRRIPVQIGGAK
jgi:alpha-tubulin suppressor-like RCC1 family protein